MIRRAAMTMMAALVAVAFWAGAQDSVDTTRVTDVKIVSDTPITVSEEAVRARMRSRAGATYSAEAVRDDIRSLYETERYDDVRIELERISETDVRLIVRLREKPVLQEIVIEGARSMKVSAIRELIELDPGEPVRESVIAAGLLEAREKYGKRGFPDARLTHQVDTDPDTGRAVVRVTVDEGRRVRVSKVEFTGNEAISSRRLRKAMETRPWNMLSWLIGSGRYLPEQLDSDLRAVRDVYREAGYVDVEIGEPQFDDTRAGRIRIMIPVTEGALYKVGTVEISGNEVFAAGELLEALQMGPGAPYSPPGERRDRDLIRDFYESRGYLDTGVAPRRIPNVETGRIDLDYRVREGTLTRIDLVEVRGNTITRDRVIRRELAVTPGELYNGPEVRASERRLRNLRFFDTVESYTEATDQPDRRDLVFEVEEGKTGSMMLGAGYSSIDDLIGIVELRQSNFDLFNPPAFRGGGQKLRLKVQAGSKREDYLLSFDEPWFLGRRLLLGTDLYHTERSYISNDYDESRTGGKLRLGRSLGDYLRGEISYTYERVDISDVDENASEAIQAEEGTRDVSMLGSSLVWDTRDNPFIPTRGARHVFDADLAGGALGADTDFYRFQGASSLFFSLKRGWLEGHVIALRGRAGVVEEYGDSDRVPIFDRYFLGGVNTIRGFEYRDVGPKDENGEPIGGRSMMMGSVEYIIPIVPQVRGALFYDTGMVYEDAYEFDPGNLNTGIGVGIRLDLPIGPVRIDYGWPIETDEFNDDSNGRLHFTMGYRF